jgi:hypothetical protein
MHIPHNSCEYKSNSTSTTPSAPPLSAHMAGIRAYIEHITAALQVRLGALTGETTRRGSTLYTLYMPAGDAPGLRVTSPGDGGRRRTYPADQVWSSFKLRGGECFYQGRTHGTACRVRS